MPARAWSNKELINNTKPHDSLINLTIAKSFHSYISNNQNLPMTIRLKLLIINLKAYFFKKNQAIYPIYSWSSIVAFAIFFFFFGINFTKLPWDLG